MIQDTEYTEFSYWTKKTYFENHYERSRFLPKCTERRRINFTFLLFTMKVLYILWSGSPGPELLKSSQKSCKEWPMSSDLQVDSISALRFVLPQSMGEPIINYFQYLIVSKCVEERQQVESLNLNLHFFNSINRKSNTSNDSVICHTHTNIRITQLAIKFDCGFTIENFVWITFNAPQSISFYIIVHWI